MKTKDGLFYCIAFNTREMDSKVVATRVQLDTCIIKDTDRVRVDLSDHPLYEALESYVLNNPSAARLRGKAKP